MFLSDDFIAVIDGVTSKSDFTYEGKTTGKIAAQMIRDALSSARRKDGIQQLLRLINEQILHFYEQVSFPYDRRQKGLQAACVIYSDYLRRIWMIGDCQAAVDGTVYLNPKKSDVILSEMRSLILHIRKAGQADWNAAETEARSQIEPWILQANAFANRAETSYGYAVLNGEDIPDSLIKAIQLDQNAHRIILTSDGYPAIKENWEQSELYLKTVLKQDPSCYTLYPSTKGIKSGQKSFDDRTYVEFLVPEIKL